MLYYIYINNIYTYEKQIEIEIGIPNHQIQEYKNYYYYINVILHIHIK